MGNKTICVLGMHRSGTSLIARILNILGVYLGPQEHLMPPDSQQNPKGFWEHQNITRLNDEILSRLGGSWHEPPSLFPGWENTSHFGDLRQKARKLVRDEFATSDFWGWKDPRTCLILPFWQRVVPSLRYVICLRNPVDVAYSLARRNGFSKEKSFDLWLLYVRSALEHTAGMSRHFVFYEDIMCNWQNSLYFLKQFLAIPETTDIGDPTANVEEFIEGDLQHYNTSIIDNVDEPRLGFPVKALYVALRIYVNSNQKITSDQFNKTLLETIDSFSHYCMEAQISSKKLQTQIGAQEVQIQEKEQTISSLLAQIDEFKNLVKSLEAHVYKKKQETETLLSEIEEQQSLVESLKGQVLEKEGLIEILSSQEVEQDKNIEKLVAFITGQQNKIESLNEQLVKKQESVNTLTQLLAEHEIRLRRITNTLGWRLLSFYGPIKYNYVLPVYEWIKGLIKPQLRKPSPEVSYAIWARHCEELRYNGEKAAKNVERFNYKPTISIIMPVYNVSKEYLSKAINSVLNQYYPFWELCICDDASTSQHIGSVLEYYAAKDKRVKVIYSERNGGIAVASNRALQLATGEFIGLLDNDDELTPDALYEVVKTLQDVTADLVYSDEDKLNIKGARCEPFFKPAWSPDLLLSYNYISHFGVYRKSIIDQIGGFQESFDGSQDYDLVLRFTEKTNKIVHIPKILYHWRKVPGSAASSTMAKPYAYDAGKKALTETLSRRGIAGGVEKGIDQGYYRVKRRITSAGKVTIIIPTRDRVELLQECINSIESKTQYEDYEIVIVNNASREKATIEFLKQTTHKVIHDSDPFNYSRLNNKAARAADGDYLVLLNNDIEVISGEWLSAMIEHAQREEVGAVGAKLLYPDNRVQHAGVVLGIGGVAGHSHKYIDGYSNSGYFSFPNVIRDYSAVTGACLMIRRKLFDEIGGLNEKELAVAFNDVDLCLRLRKQGFLVVYTPYALLYHYESASRGIAVNQDEVSYMMAKYRSELLNDPYYNPNLSLIREDFSIEFSKPESFYCVYSQESSDEIVGYLREGRLIGQKLFIDQDDLCAIAIRFGTFRSVCKGLVRLYLGEANEVDSAIPIVTDASLIKDNEYYIFSFDPILNSGNKVFYFYVELVNHTPDSKLTIWKSSFNSDAMGPHFEDHQPSSGTLSFKVFCQKQFRNMA